jgi:hypothetical protein
MPVITNVCLSLSAGDVTRAWGSRRARRASPRMLTLVSEILARMDAEHWLQPAISYRIWGVAGHGSGWMELTGGTRLQASLLTRHVSRATHLAIGVCTLGGVLGKRVSEWFASGDRLRAVLLDEIGTLALYKLSDQLEETIREAAGLKGLEASGVLSPGEDGFDLREQGTVVELAGGADIGVSLTDTGMLVPHKTLSMLVGLGNRMPRWSRAERCARCQKRARCPHRRLVAEAVAT